MLSEEETSLLEPPQLIESANLSALLDGFSDCIVDIPSTSLETIKLRKASVIIELVNVNFLSVDYEVEYDENFVPSDNSTIPDDASDILSDYPEDEEEDYDWNSPEFTEVEKILARSNKV